MLRPSAAPVRTSRACRGSLSRLFVAVVALLACVAQAAAQQPVATERVVVDGGGDMVLTKSGEEAAPGNSTVRGRAVFEETGRPVRRARVMLLLEHSAPGAGVTAQGLTNARGEFEFKGVRAGHYFVAVFAPGVLTPFSFADPYAPRGGQSGWRDPEEIKKFLEEIAVDGATDAEVTVKAKRGGAISGRVSYEDGAPGVSANVSLYRKAGDKLLRAQAAQADDRGIYRFTGLAPGDYVVGVSELVQHGDAGMARANAGLYAGGGGALFSTYYPAATKIGAATPITVGAGEEHEGADITIAERELHAVAGTVRSRANSKPVAGASVTVSDADSPPELTGYAAAMPDAVTDEHGRFTLREIPQGDYVITVRPAADVDATELLTPLPRATPKPTPTPADEEAEGDEDLGYRAPLQRYTVKEQRLKIAGADVDDLDIALESGAFVTGTVVFEGGKGEPSYVSVSAVRVGEAASAEGESGTYFDGQFAVGGLSPGRYFLSVGAADEEGTEYYVKSMTCNGTDLTREPLRVEAGATLRCVRIVLATGTGTLKGRVLTDGDGKPAPGANVFAVPSDQAKWQTPGGQSQATADQSGKFELELPPGDYLVFALPPGGSTTLSADEIKTHAARARRVTLRAKQTTSAELTLRDGN